jgi:hypothetical protein
VNEGTSEQVRKNNYFTVTSVKQVQVKKFKTTGTDYTESLLLPRRNESHRERKVYGVAQWFKREQLCV